MSVFKASVKIRPDLYRVSSALGLTILWVPLNQEESQSNVLNSVHSWLNNKYDLTRWAQNVTQAEANYLVVVLQLFSDDSRKPTEVVVSNDDGTNEIEKISLQTTKVNVLRYAHVTCELPKKTSHRLEIILVEQS
jgi:hypothetical protein